MVPSSTSTVPPVFSVNSRRNPSPEPPLRPFLGRYIPGYPPKQSRPSQDIIILRRVPLRYPPVPYPRHIADQRPARLESQRYIRGRAATAYIGGIRQGNIGRFLPVHHAVAISVIPRAIAGSALRPGYFPYAVSGRRGRRYPGSVAPADGQRPGLPGQQFPRQLKLDSRRTAAHRRRRLTPDRHGQKSRRENCQANQTPADLPHYTTSLKARAVSAAPVLPASIPTA